MNEFRIKYNIGEDHAELNNFHYYMAESSIQALAFHYDMARKKNLKMQTLSVEKYCKYAEKWIDESEVLNKNISLENV